MEVSAGLEPGALQDRLDHLAGRPRVRGGLEDDEVAVPQPHADLLGGADDDREVRLPLLRQRSRQRDQDRVGAPDLVVIRRRANLPVPDERRELLGGHVDDVAHATVDSVDDLGRDVD